MTVSSAVDSGPQGRLPWQSRTDAWRRCCVDYGSFSSGLLTGLREGVEAALIVSIILAYLAKTGNQRHFGTIWLGAGAAIAVSVAVGLFLFVTIGGLQEAAGENL